MKKIRINKKNSVDKKKNNGFKNTITKIIRKTMSEIGIIKIEKIF